MSEVEFQPISGFRGGKIPDTYRLGYKYESPIKINYVEEMATRLSEELDNHTFAAMLKAEITVDRDEMIKALSYDRDQYRKGYYDGFTDGQKPCWIRTEDELPPDRQKVLIARICEKDGPLIAEQGYRYGDGWWKVFGTNLRDRSVLYWMPLPDPPERSEDG